jgi:hypothetical protein
MNKNNMLVFVDKSGKPHYSNIRKAKRADLEEVFFAALDFKKGAEVLIRPEEWPTPVWDRYQRLRNAMSVIFQHGLSKKKGLLP